MTPARDDDLVYTIVLTGGPCGGKTTSMAHLSDLLEGLGYRVFLVPEAATLMMTSGATPLGGARQRLLFQSSLIRLQMALEDCFTELARGCGQPAVVLCDRGTMDTSAYLSAELWQTLLSENGW
ncbi:MAG: ATP-binding protein, partial [Myxococcota bacterium]